MGAAVCKVYEESRIENVLDRVTEGVKKCAVCGFQCSNTQEAQESHQDQISWEDIYALSTILIQI